MSSAERWSVVSSLCCEVRCLLSEDAAVEVGKVVSGAGVFGCDLPDDLESPEPSTIGPCVQSM